MNCPTGKAQYATSAAAARVQKAMDKRHSAEKRGAWHRGVSMVYRCPVCHEWHIGHSTQPIKNRKPRYEPVCDWSAA